MTDCAFINCINNGERKETIDSEPLPEVTYHLFPKDDSLREKWVKQMNQENWMPNEESLLCSLHFNKDYFVEDEQGIPQLKPDAIPTEFEMYQKVMNMGEEGTVECCAIKCHNSLTPESTVTFHPFPLDQPELCAQWLAAMHYSQIDASQAVLCSDHFDASCFVVGDDGQRYLMSDAVPSLFFNPDENDSMEATNAVNETDPEPEPEAEPEPEPEQMSIERLADDSDGVFKYEISEDALQLIHRHDGVVGAVIEETQKLIQLRQKRMKLEKKRRDLQMLLRASINNSSFDKEQLRLYKPLLREINEIYVAVHNHCTAPCMMGSVTLT